jgi:hypothetical protein
VLTQLLIPFLNQSAIFVGRACPAHAGSSASSIRRGGPASPPPCRLNIIFDLEMVLIIGHKKFLLRAEEKNNQDYVIKTCYSDDNVLLATPILRR